MASFRIVQARDPVGHVRPRSADRYILSLGARAADVNAIKGITFVAGIRDATLWQKPFQKLVNVCVAPSALCRMLSSTPQMESGRYEGEAPDFVPAHCEALLCQLLASSFLRLVGPRY